MIRLKRKLTENMKSGLEEGEEIGRRIGGNPMENRLFPKFLTLNFILYTHMRFFVLEKLEEAQQFGLDWTTGRLTQQAHANCYSPHLPISTSNLLFFFFF